MRYFSVGAMLLTALAVAAFHIGRFQTAAQPSTAVTHTRRVPTQFDGGVGLDRRETHRKVIQLCIDEYGGGRLPEGVE